MVDRSTTLPRIIPEDLAPGDQRARDVDWSALRALRVRDPHDPLFHRAYDRLWREFGDKGEMERRDVIEARLAWDPRRPVQGHALLYELLVVLAGDAIVGLRDHTAIVPPPRAGAPRHAVVHLSHVIVEPALRGGGLSGWLRAFPLQTARACAAPGGGCEKLTLIGEMERPDGQSLDQLARLRSYHRAGFRAIDPDRVGYRQPDFRPPGAIEVPQPVPLMLVVRRVGAEAEAELAGDEVRELVAALYTMFGAHVLPAHMAELWADVARLPGAGERVALRPLL